ncbi:potassium voltage-gated channel subfamily KQT member 1-like isoform X4 [Porites lutea]|uniref:potassium voltage-gated channel subfamily KQT member 1-like isoform X4 n=1 Tax=Porites lutea TaxID=51062 RepID=UPI003CC501A3
MTRPVTADLRRESIDMLGVGGSFNEKHSANSFVDEATENFQMRRLDQASKKSADSAVQNGHRSRDEKHRQRFTGKISRIFPEDYRKIQNYCFRFLEMPRGFLSFSYHALLFILVIVSLILTVLSTVQTEDNNFQDILHVPVLVVEITLIILFVIEYIIRLWAAGCRSAYVGIKGRLRFAVQIYSIIDMIVIISSIVAISVASYASSSSVRLLRFLPLLRVLRFDRQAGTWKLLGSVIYVHRQELLTTFYLGFLTLIFASFVLYMAEKDANDTDFESWPSSFWWGVVTLTTIGYGDATPKTWHGKLCAALFFLCGISFFALPAGILGSGFALKVTQQQRQKHFHRRRRPAAILLQSYWRLFCADLNSKSVATWLPSIYYNRQQHLLKNVLEKSGTATDGRSKPGLCSSHDALMTMFSSHNIHCSIVHPIKGSRPGSLVGDENMLLSLQNEGEIPCIELSNAQKLAIRLIRILKLRVAIRKFKEARRPYDVKDVIEQYSTGHVEMLARVKNLQAKMDKAFGERIDGTDDETAGKVGINNRLSRVERQVHLMDSKLEAVLQILQNIQNSPNYPSGGSNAYEFFRGHADGVSSRRSSVSRAHSDPLDVRTQMALETNQITTNVTPNSDIPCVTLSDPESVQSSLSFGDRPHSSRTTSLGSLHGSLTGGDHPNTVQLDGLYISDVGTLNAPQLSRILVSDKRQLSDVTEESLTGSKETIGFPGSMSQQNSTASETDPAAGADESEPKPGEISKEKERAEVDVEPGPGDIEVVWEKQEPTTLSRRRKRSQLSLDRTSESELQDEKASREQHSPSFSTGEGEAFDDRDVAERYTGTPERRDSINGRRRSAGKRDSQVYAEGRRSPRDSEAGRFDELTRTTPTRMSAKRRPLVKSNPVDV